MPHPAEPATEAFDAVVLAGGTARRLGGVSKPDVELAGRRLLDHALDAAAGARRTVVVAPASVEVPAGVLRTLEDPPHGGPVAGIAAGLAALERDDPGAPAPAPAPASAVRAGNGARPGLGVSAADDGAGPAADGAGPRCDGPSAPIPALVLVLACDVPGAAGAVPHLVRAALGSPGGACLVDADGRRQRLVGVYRRASLEARLVELGGGRDLSVRALLAGLDLAEVRAGDAESADVDTWADLAAIEARTNADGRGELLQDHHEGGGTGHREG